jgi:phytoene dehydrogenase-like protein
MSLDQFWAARPAPSHGDYRAPIAGPCPCGSGAHPKARVTGTPGHEAARAILAIDRQTEDGRSAAKAASTLRNE